MQHLARSHWDIVIPVCRQYEAVRWYTRTGHTGTESHLSADSERQGMVHLDRPYFDRVTPVCRQWEDVGYGTTGLDRPHWDRVTPVCRQ